MFSRSVTNLPKNYIASINAGSFVSSVAYSPDGNNIVSGTNALSVQVWDTKSYKSVTTFGSYSDGDNSVAYNSNGTYIATDSHKYHHWEKKTTYSITIWESVRKRFSSLSSYSNKWIPKIKLEAIENFWTVNSVSFSPNKLYIASGSNDYYVRVWNIESGKCIAKLDKGIGGACSVSYSPDGKYIASGLENSSVKVWDVDITRNTYSTCIATLNGEMGHSKRVTSISYSPDGKYIASGSSDKTVKVWEWESATCVATLNGHVNIVRSVAYSPDGNYIASGSYDNLVKVWDWKTGVCTETLEGHTDAVMSVAYSPNGHNIASGSLDHTIKIWDVSNLLRQAGGKKSKTTKKEKLIDTYKKSDLIKIAKKHEISLKTKDKTPKTKLQLFNSLKRKKLVH